MSGLIRSVSLLRHTPQASAINVVRWIHQEVRVRFAPSPTGYLHIGGLRTALYNYLFARSKGGKFILRIEDTDQKRLIPGATQKLVEMLQWSGIEIDEGPGLGGNYGPYMQSQRVRTYWQYVDHLLENGTAYRCFCTPKRLELLRKDALRRMETPKYDNKCRHLSEREIEEKLHNSESYVIRFKLEEHSEPWQDMVYGPISTDVAKVEGDPVLIKADRFPTYHFANVVDDHLMDISHVLRGVEWQVSTTKHILLYKAFGWTPPQFGHLPLLFNKEGKKISKRHNEGQVEYFRDNGYSATTLINLLTSQGSGFTQPDTVGLHLNELIPLFDVGLLNTNSTKLDFAKLADINRENIRRLLADNQTASQMVYKLRLMVYQNIPFEEMDEKLIDEMLSDKHLLDVIRWSLHRISRIEDLIDEDFLFLWTTPSKDIINKLIENEHARDVLSFFVGKIEKCETINETWVRDTLKNYSKKEEIKFKEVMSIIRKAISGLEEGPSIGEMCVIMGKHMLAYRLNYVLNLMTESREKVEDSLNSDA